MLVNNLLEESAIKYAGKTALITSEGHYTYKEIDDMADKTANALMAQGLKKGDRVAIFMDNSMEAVACIYGVLKADGVFLMVNPTTKTEKLTYIFNNCRVTAVMSSQSLINTLSVACNNTLSLKDVYLTGDDINQKKRLHKRTHSLTEILNGGNGYQPESRSIDIDLANIIYTSGSTGNPKGVMMTHRNMVSAATSITTYLENTSDDIILNTLPMSFDYGLYQVIMAFMAGATVILEKTFMYPYKVIDTIIKEKVTGFPLVPTISAILLQMEDIKNKSFDHLRYISSTADTLPVAHIKKLRKFFPKTKVYSMYGLTECKRVSYLPPDQLDTRPTSVGKAMPNTNVYIVDDKGERVGPNVTGKLVVRGSNVMRGYWEMPEETAKILRQGPYAGETVLHTGDLFRADEESYLYFIGRSDDIIKSRGEKVSPKEIENILYEIDGVIEAAVVGIDDPVLGQAIKAFVVKSSGTDLTEKSVQKFCSKHLEDFMVPKFVEFKKELPKTPSGKIIARQNNRNTMTLFDENEIDCERPAIIDTSSGQTRTFNELRDEVNSLAERLRYPRKALVFCFCRFDLASVTGYLASLNGGHAVCLLDGLASDELKKQVIKIYQPDFIIETAQSDNEGSGLDYESLDGYCRKPDLFEMEGKSSIAIWKNKNEVERNIHDSLSVLLSTSGTTGSPKLVRLSMENILSNASSIKEYLGISSDEKPISSLPIHYSYGLSILNSHLLAGACLVMTDRTVMYPKFWEIFNENKCTSFAGVPYSYKLLDRIGFGKISTPSLRTMTQAGGKMETPLIKKFDELLKKRSARLVVMYGQTEATARISYLPADKLPEKLGSLGIPIPGGKISIYNGAAEITEPNKTGEFVYYGKNVMMGYATSSDDLAKGDLMNGELRTGDLGYFDEDGYFFIKGRIKRFVKIFGNRINLDEIEEKLKAHGPTAVAGTDEKIYVFCEYGDGPEYIKYQNDLAKVYKINRSVFEFQKMDPLPVKSSGKIDYKKLNEMIDSVLTTTSDG